MSLEPQELPTTPPIDSFRGEYRFLSNFWQVDVVLDGVTYPSTEHAYQAAKTLDLAVREQFLALKTADAKYLGQKLVVRSDWDSVKLSVMEDLLRQKFKRPDLREKLLATGDAELIEGNFWNDRFWGVCKGSGLNHLGKLLMKVRKEIQDGLL